MDEVIILPTPLVATLSVAWTGDALNCANVNGFARSPATEHYFEKVYDCAFGFIFNESFPLHSRNTGRRIDGKRMEFIGTSVFEPNGALGPYQCDAACFAFDDEDGISTHLLQLHFRFRRATQSVDKAFLKGYCGYMDRFTSPEEVLVDKGGVDDPALALWMMALRNRRTGRFRTERERRRYALSHSYFLVTSAYGLDRQVFERRDTLRQSIYSLLYRHPTGVGNSAETAQGRGWSSTNFFEAWFEPGAAVILSTGFPEDSYSLDGPMSASFFDVLFDNYPGDVTRVLNSDEFAASVSDVNSNRSGYDTLPEYPPLRYVAPAAALYGLLYEEVLRDTYERLLVLSNSPSLNPFVRLARFIADGEEIRTLMRRIARIDTLEHLRLPVSRPLGELIVTSKLQDRVARAIDQLAANRLALVGQTLAIAGTVLAIVGVVTGIISVAR